VVGFQARARGPVLAARLISMSPLDHGVDQLSLKNMLTDQHNSRHLCFGRRPRPATAGPAAHVAGGAGTIAHPILSSGSLAILCAGTLIPVDASGIVAVEIRRDI